MTLMETDASLSRISKLLIDRDEISVEDALAQRKRFAVTLVCGADVASSRGLQIAVLTAANIAQRCFPGSVRLRLNSGLAESPSLVWPALKQTFADALAIVLGSDALSAQMVGTDDWRLLFGDVSNMPRALRVTFDGWIAKAGPADQVERMTEREYCSLASVLTGGLGVSELFLRFAEISLTASRRTVGLSLWRPDLPVSDPDALGPRVQSLPSELWVLGLGHLGNGYLWSLATLPYANTGDLKIFLNDFDQIQDANVETSMLFDGSLIGRLKTRACAEWLEARGFQTRLIERHFDGNFRRRDDEPGLALCGFDSNAARRDLATALFRHVAESGLGGTPNNFDTINFHTFPNLRSAADLWPDVTPAEIEKLNLQAKRRANENAAYTQLGGDECGRLEIAGKSIAVPFVGTAASTLVIADVVRLLHRGPRYHDIKISLGTPDQCVARFVGTYKASDFAGLRAVSRMQQDK